MIRNFLGFETKTFFPTFPLLSSSSKTLEKQIHLSERPLILMKTTSVRRIDVKQARKSVVEGKYECSRNSKFSQESVLSSLCIEEKKKEGEEEDSPYSPRVQSFFSILVARRTTTTSDRPSVAYWESLGDSW